MLSKVIYKGDLRTVSTHLQSGNVILTDAPVDNHGRGEAFSPTDMVTNALASCAMTIMGIKAQELNLDLTNSFAEVYKEMSTEPRAIKKIIIHFTMQGVTEKKERIILERVAMHCPVFLSLHPNVEKEITFNWL